MVSCFDVGFVGHIVNFSEGLERHQLVSGVVGLVLVLIIYICYEIVHEAQ